MVINMVIMNIDATDESLKQQALEKRKKLLRIIKEKGCYGANDFVLVRTTDYLSDDNVIRPLCHVPFLVKNNHAIKRVINDLLDEQDHIDFYQEEERFEERQKLITDNYLPYSSQYRSTVHFCINGLVSSHAKGNFDNRHFVIIDHIMFHLTHNDIRSFRVEDTFFYGNVPLSSDAVILIKEQEYDELLMQYPQLQQAKVVLYKGLENDAVNIYLASIGIVSEEIKEHGSLEHECSFYFRQFQKLIKEKYEIDNEPHWLSKEYRQDDEYNLIIWEYYERLFYTYLLKLLNIEESQFSNLLTMLLNIDQSQENRDKLKEIIKNMGLFRFGELVDNFNRQILDSIVNGTFMNNDEIIQSLTGIQK